MARKNNQNTYPDGPPAPASIGDSQSSTTNPQISSYPDPLQPDSLIPWSPLASVSCLSPVALCEAGSPPPFVFCLLPKLPILPLVLLSLDILSSLFFVSSWLQLNYAKQTQFPKLKNHLNPLCDKDLQEKHSMLTRKKQSQTKPTTEGSPERSRRIKPNPPPAIRNTRYKPNLSRTGRHTKYDTRSQTQMEHGLLEDFTL